MSCKQSKVTQHKEKKYVIVKEMKKEKLVNRNQSRDDTDNEIRTQYYYL